MRGSRAGGPAILAACLATLACARALKEPASLADLAGGRPPVPADQVDDLLRRAEILYATRDLEKVREAGLVCLTAAQSDPHRIEGLVGASRAYVWLVDHEPDPKAREKDAAVAVQASQWCARAAPADAACAYWLGASLGVQARERPSTGLDALHSIEEAFRRAAEASPAMEEAGPDRALALFYLRAPGWPAGPGDPERGLEHARRAVASSPNYPPNHLALAEALLANEDPEGSHEEYRRAIELARRMQVDGDPDAPQWIQEAEEALSGRPGAH